MFQFPKERVGSAAFGCSQVVFLLRIRNDDIMDTPPAPLDPERAGLSWNSSFLIPPPPAHLISFSPSWTFLVEILFGFLSISENRDECRNSLQAKWRKAKFGNAGDTCVITCIAHPFWKRIDVLGDTWYHVSFRHTSRNSQSHVKFLLR